MGEVPIGSIVAYAGIIYREEFEAANSGWMLCDGRRLNRNDPAFTDLFNAIGFAWGGDGVARFNLPDLQGYFLRGVDEREPDQSRDPDSLTRTAIRPGGAEGPSVGSAQSYATANPVERPFVMEASGRHKHSTDSSGDHQHTIDFQINATRDVGGTGNTVAHPAPSPPAKPKTDLGGRHSHETGQAIAHTHFIEPRSGDNETRPINAYVNWIIRVQ